jgi:hypothetical protein
MATSRRKAKTQTLKSAKRTKPLPNAKPRPRPQFGAMKDERKWPDGWDRPLTDVEADAFWEGRDC